MRKKQGESIKLPAELQEKLRKWIASYLERGEKGPSRGELLIEAWEQFEARHKAAVSQNTPKGGGLDAFGTSSQPSPGAHVIELTEDQKDILEILSADPQKVDEKARFLVSTVQTTVKHALQEFRKGRPIPVKETPSPRPRHGRKRASS